MQIMGFNSTEMPFRRRGFRSRFRRKRRSAFRGTRRFRRTRTKRMSKPSKVSVRDFCPWPDNYKYKAKQSIIAVPNATLSTGGIRFYQIKINSLNAPQQGPPTILFSPYGTTELRNMYQLYQIGGMSVRVEILSAAAQTVPVCIGLLPTPPGFTTTTLDAYSINELNALPYAKHVWIPNGLTTKAPKLRHYISVRKLTGQTKANVQDDDYIGVMGADPVKLCNFFLYIGSIPGALSAQIVAELIVNTKQYTTLRSRTEQRGGL